jgi:hypothetical protein
MKYFKKSADIHVKDTFEMIQDRSPEALRRKFREAFAHLPELDLDTGVPRADKLNKSLQAYLKRLRNLPK